MISLLRPSLLLLIAAGAGFAQDTNAAYAPIANPEAAGQELALRLRSRPPAQNAEFTGSLRVIPRDGPRRQIPIACNIHLRVDDAGVPTWDAIYRTRPTDNTPAEVLVVRFRHGESNRYCYATGAAAAQPVDSLPAVQGLQLATALAGSDFWLMDLGLEFLHWPQQKAIKTEMRRGQVCRVLESVNPAAGPAGYQRVVSWIPIREGEAEGILQAEAYGRDGRLLKEFSLGSFKKVDGEWQLQDMRIINLPARSRTWLEFDLGE